MAIGVGPVSVPAPRIPPAVPWTLTFVGAAILYAALRNESPMALLRQIIRGELGNPSPIDPGRNFTGSGGDFVETPTADPRAGGGGGHGARGPDDAANSPGRPASLVKVVQGAGRPDVYMTLAAAQAFTAWQLAFRARIPLTGAWRSYEEQARQHAADPDRFGSPEHSAHVAGVAVDVDQIWINSLPAAEQSRLRKMAKVTGWGQARYKRGEAGCGAPASGKKSDNDEPWHFSWGRCS